MCIYLFLNRHLRIDNKREQDNFVLRDVDLSCIQSKVHLLVFGPIYNLHIPTHSKILQTSDPFKDISSH